MFPISRFQRKSSLNLCLLSIYKFHFQPIRRQQKLLLPNMALSSGAAYKDYFDNKTLSDLTLRISDRRVYAHRIVLSSHSAYFNKLLTSGFKIRDSLAIHLQSPD